MFSSVFAQSSKKPARESSRFSISIPDSRESLLRGIRRTGTSKKKSANNYKSCAMGMCSFSLGVAAIESCPSLVSH